jgi:hypothetical protein
VGSGGGGWQRLGGHDATMTWEGACCEMLRPSNVASGHARARATRYGSLIYDG